MKIKVWNKREAEKTQDKNQLFLRLRSTSEDDILLQVVDINGDKLKNGNILYIDLGKKMIFTMGGLTEKLPLKTDVYGGALTYPHELLPQAPPKESATHIKVKSGEEMLDLLKKIISSSKQI
jgi:hypothetical protein